MAGDKRSGNGSSGSSRGSSINNVLSLSAWGVRLSWGMLGGQEEGVLLAERPSALVYTGFLLGPSGTFKYVVYKVPRVQSEEARAALRHEARVLHALRDVQGVPKLYGLTFPPTEAIVMSFCPGEALQTFLRQDAARTYLEALRKACLTLKAMHDLDVTHGNLHARNILVAERLGRGHAEQMTVSVVGLQGATIGGKGWEKWEDLHSVVGMTQDIRGHLVQDLMLNGHVDKELAALAALSPAHLDWMTVLVALCRALHGGQPAFCLLCMHEIWTYFKV